MKRTVVWLVVLLGLLLVADRVGAAFAAQAVAAQVQTATRLTSEPDVDMGFPFLTQAVAGRYDEVEVTARDVPAGELTIARLDATLTGVEVPLSEAISGSVAQVPVAGVTARALVAYEELARRSGDRQLILEPEGDRVRVSGTVDVSGQPVTVTALARVEVAGGDVLVTADSYDVGGAPPNEAITRALAGRLDLRIPVTGLPYGLQVTDVEVTPEGLSVHARAGATVLSSRSSTG